MEAQTIQRAWQSFCGSLREQAHFQVYEFSENYRNHFWAEYSLRAAGTAPVMWHELLNSKTANAKKHVEFLAAILLCAAALPEEARQMFYQVQGNAIRSRSRAETTTLWPGAARACGSFGGVFRSERIRQ